MKFSVPGLADATTGREPHAAGRLMLIVAKVPEVKRNKADTADYLNWEFNVEGEENSKIWHITSLQEAALFGLKGLLAALEKGNNVTLLEGDDFDDTACVGLKVEGNVVIDAEYNNNKITQFYAVS